MTNENKNINELVSNDDDPTAELEALTIRGDFSRPGKSASSESDLNTHGFEDSETVERLKFDIEQLRAKWLGLETEIKAREEKTTKKVGIFSP